MKRTVAAALVVGLGASAVLGVGVAQRNSAADSSGARTAPPKELRSTGGAHGGRIAISEDELVSSSDRIDIVEVTAIGEAIEIDDPTGEAIPSLRAHVISANSTTDVASPIREFTVIAGTYDVAVGQRYLIAARRTELGSKRLSALVPLFLGSATADGTFLDRELDMRLEGSVVAATEVGS